MERETPEASLVGTVVDGKYEIERLLGRGGMGAVYAARQLQLDRKVALKVLRPELVVDGAAVTRFTREARASARIEHPNAVRVYDFGSFDAGGAYIVMELLEGVPLRAMLKRGRVVPLEVVLQIVWQATAAVGAAHAMGIVHRDLKPENLMVRLGDDGAVDVKVVDFGLAKLLKSDATQLTGPAEMLGTPKYMAPEQFDGAETDERVDIYALGVITYELIAGRPPFEGSFGEIIGKHLYAEPPEFASIGVEVPEAVERVVRAALAKDPSERTRTPGELARNIVRAFGLEPATATAPIGEAAMTSALALISELAAADGVEAHGPQGLATQVVDRVDEVTQLRRGAPAPWVLPDELAAPARDEPVPQEPERAAAEPGPLGRYRVAVAASVLSAVVVAAAGYLAWSSLGGERDAPAPAATAAATPEPAPALPAEEPAAAEPVAVEPPDPPVDRSPSARIGGPLRFEDGTIVIPARGSNIMRGARLVVTGATASGDQVFPLVLNEGKTEWLVDRTAVSEPGGLDVDAAIPPGSIFEYTIRNPNGRRSEANTVARPSE